MFPKGQKTTDEALLAQLAKDHPQSIVLADEAVVIKRLHADINNLLQRGSKLTALLKAIAKKHMEVHVQVVEKGEAIDVSDRVFEEKCVVIIDINAMMDEINQSLSGEFEAFYKELDQTFQCHMQVYDVLFAEHQIFSNEEHARMPSLMTEGSLNTRMTRLREGMLDAHEVLVNLSKAIPAQMRQVTVDQLAFEAHHARANAVSQQMTDLKKQIDDLTKQQGAAARQAALIVSQGNTVDKALADKINELTEKINKAKIKLEDIKESHSIKEYESLDSYLKEKPVSESQQGDDAAFNFEENSQGIFSATLVGENLRDNSNSLLSFVSDRMHETYDSKISYPFMSNTVYAKHLELLGVKLSDTMDAVSDTFSKTVDFETAYSAFIKFEDEYNSLLNNGLMLGEHTTGLRMIDRAGDELEWYEKGETVILRYGNMMGLNDEDFKQLLKTLGKETGIVNQLQLHRQLTVKRQSLAFKFIDRNIEEIKRVYDGIASGKNNKKDLEEATRKLEKLIAINNDLQEAFGGFLIANPIAVLHFAENVNLLIGAMHLAKKALVNPVAELNEVIEALDKQTSTLVNVLDLTDSEVYRNARKAIDAAELNKNSEYYVQVDAVIDAAMKIDQKLQKEDVTNFSITAKKENNISPVANMAAMLMKGRPDVIVVIHHPNIRLDLQKNSAAYAKASMYEQAYADKLALYAAIDVLVGKVNKNSISVEELIKEVNVLSGDKASEKYKAKMMAFVVSKLMPGNADVAELIHQLSMLPSVGQSSRAVEGIQSSFMNKVTTKLRSKTSSTESAAATSDSPPPSPAPSLRTVIIMEQIIKPAAKENASIFLSFLKNYDVTIQSDAIDQFYAEISSIKEGDPLYSEVQTIFLDKFIAHVIAHPDAKLNDQYVTAMVAGQSTDDNFELYMIRLSLSENSDNKNAVKLFCDIYEKIDRVDLLILKAFSSKNASVIQICAEKYIPQLLSQRTADDEIKSIYEKLGADDKGQFIDMLLTHFSGEMDRLVNYGDRAAGYKRSLMSVISLCVQFNNGENFNGLDASSVKNIIFFSKYLMDGQPGSVNKRVVFSTFLSILQSAPSAARQLYILEYFKGMNPNHNPFDLGYAKLTGEEALALSTSVSKTLDLLLLDYNEDKGAAGTKHKEYLRAANNLALSALNQIDNSETGLRDRLVGLLHHIAKLANPDIVNLKAENVSKNENAKVIASSTSRAGSSNEPSASNKIQKKINEINQKIKQKLTVEAAEDNSRGPIKHWERQIAKIDFLAELIHLARKGDKDGFEKLKKQNPLEDISRTETAKETANKVTGVFKSKEKSPTFDNPINDFTRDLAMEDVTKLENQEEFLLFEHDLAHHKTKAVSELIALLTIYIQKQSTEEAAKARSALTNHWDHYNQQIAKIDHLMKLIDIALASGDLVKNSHGKDVPKEKYFEKQKGKDPVAELSVRASMGASHDEYMDYVQPLSVKLIMDDKETFQGYQKSLLAQRAVLIDKRNGCKAPNILKQGFRGMLGKGPHDVAEAAGESSSSSTKVSLFSKKAQSIAGSSSNSDSSSSKETNTHSNIKKNTPDTT